MILALRSLPLIQYGNLQEDYHSVAANPSFEGGHGTLLPFTAPYGLEKQSHPPSMVTA